MGTALKVLIVQVLKNLVAMLGTPKVAVWAAKQAAKMSDNLIDDNLVEFLDCARTNDVEGAIKYAEAALAELRKLKAFNTAKNPG